MHLGQPRLCRCIAAIRRPSVPLGRLEPLGIGSGTFRDHIAERELCRHMIALRCGAVAPFCRLSVRSYAKTAPQAYAQVVFRVGVAQRGSAPE